MGPVDLHWVYLMPILCLPWVLFGIRTFPKEDLKASAAELVFGEQLTVPGSFITPHTLPWTHFQLVRQFPRHHMIMVLLLFQRSVYKTIEDLKTLAEVSTSKSLHQYYTLNKYDVLTSIEINMICTELQ